MDGLSTAIELTGIRALSACPTNRAPSRRPVSDEATIATCSVPDLGVAPPSAPDRVALTGAGCETDLRALRISRRRKWKDPNRRRYHLARWSWRLESQALPPPCGFPPQATVAGFRPQAPESPASCRWDGRVKAGRSLHRSTSRWETMWPRNNGRYAVPDLPRWGWPWYRPRSGPWTPARWRKGSQNGGPEKCPRCL